jgi:hypothetical protein
LTLETVLPVPPLCAAKQTIMAPSTSCAGRDMSRISERYV